MATESLVRVEFRFGPEFQYVAVEHDEYITTVSCDGTITRCHSDMQVDDLVISCRPRHTSISVGETQVVLDLVEFGATVFAYTQTEVWEIERPTRDFEPYVPPTPGAFRPTQSHVHHLRHYYSGDCDAGDRPHGEGVGVWPNGEVYVGEWRHGRPGGRGYGLTSHGAVRYAHGHAFVTLSHKGRIISGVQTTPEGRVRGFNYAHIPFLPRFRPLPVCSVLTTHFIYWSMAAHRRRADRAMRALIRSETSSAPTKKKKRRPRRSLPAVVAPPDAEEEDTEKEDVQAVVEDGGDAEEETRVAAPSKEPLEEEDESTLCVVCLTRPRSHAIVPCGHMCLCRECTPTIGPTCPMCRCDVSTTVRIYMS